MSTGRPGLAQRTHEASVLRVLRERGALRRGEIAELVGVSRTTLSDLAGRLLERGAIVIADTDAASRAGSGRPAELLALDPGSGQFMGVDFSHREVHVAVADASHEIIASGHDTYGATSTGILSWNRYARGCCDASTPCCATAARTSTTG